jgi:O-6-methylguanine DNA methyltransferase
VEVVPYEVEGWGVGELYLEGGRLLYHELPRPLPKKDVSRGQTPIQDTHGNVTAVVERLLAYFRGERTSFEDVEIDLSWMTPFQGAVAVALRHVPYGEVVTYGELAALAGHPNAQRAAGTFCAGNRFPLFVPCHRVVAADGLGSYGSLGTDYKRRLLALEGVVV